MGDGSAALISTGVNAFNSATTAEGPVRFLDSPQEVLDFIDHEDVEPGGSS